MSILKFYDYITESNDIVYKYGAVMTKFKFPKWKELLSEIDEADLSDNDKKVEEDAHVTILYGLHKDVDMKEVKKIFTNIKPINIKVVDVSVFKKDMFDVVKFGIESNELAILNQWVKQSFKNSEKFPDYKPHATIAYLKPGKGKNYIDKLTKKYLKDGPIDITLTDIIISDPENKEIKVKLKK